MGIVSGVVVYFLTFWLVIFCVLPFGNKPPTQIEAGHAGSAPENPRIGKKLLITAGISAIIWLVIYTLVVSDLVSFSWLGDQLSIAAGIEVPEASQ